VATNVYMEALSPTMEEGRVVKWHKGEGEPVKTGDVLAEVETDKAVMDLVARADGVLRSVAAAEGQTVAVGTVVAVIAAPGDGASAAGPASAPAAAKPAASAAREAGGGAAAAAALRSPVAAVAAAGEAGGPGRVKASPLARRMARDSGVDLKLVAGSGPGGRVVKRDLEGAVRGAATAVVPAPASSAVTAPAAAPPSAPAPARAPAPRPTEPARAGVPYEDVPLTQIRKTIARRLATSLGPIPHFFLTTEVDMERAAEARDALNRQLGERGKLSFNDIIIKATALALRKHRECNAWFQEDHIRYWNEVHIGMAVAVEDGLITPVIRNADLKTLTEIGREAQELAERARNRRLQPSEYTGATFSVSNLGMFDIDEFTAVINPPESGIIAIGSIGARPVVVDGQLVPRRRMRITMSCDHRVIDGATGAVFLKTLKQMLENPLAMLA
jgi:pyruvate dehydrogenase E2 component (dihydrolipoamide acetyltransferase)